MLHSEIRGSKLVCSYPRLIAAYHVLHRLSMPRHPSSALSSLTTKIHCLCLLVSTHCIPICHHIGRICFACHIKWLSLHLTNIFNVNEHRGINPAVSLPESPPGKRFFRSAKMVGVLGVEPRTSSLSGTRSNQLSYTPISVLVEPKGLEPSTSCLQSRHSSQLS